MGICPIQWRKVFPWYWLHWQETIQIDTGMASKLLLLHLSKYNCFNIQADVGTVQKKYWYCTKLTSKGSRLLYWHFSTNMILLHYFVKPTVLLNWLFYQTGWYTCSCLLMLVQYKVDFVSVPNYTVTVQNMSFSFGVLCHMNCQRMNKKTQHKLKLHVKKLGCGECTVNITHTYR